MKKASFRFSDKERQILEDVDQKGTKDSPVDIELLVKMMGYEEKRIKNWVYHRRRLDKSFTTTEKQQLQAAYQKNPCAGEKKVAELAKKLNIENESRIHMWFCRKRHTDNIPSRIIHLNNEDIKYLSAIYAENGCPYKQEIHEIAKELGVSARIIRNWFQSKRSLDKRLGSVAAQDKRKDSVTRSNDQRFNSRIFNQKLYTKEPILTLKEEYQKNKYLTSEVLDALKEITGLKRIRIQRWFNYERMKERITKNDGPDPHHGKNFKPEEVLLVEQTY